MRLAPTTRPERSADVPWHGGRVAVLGVALVALLVARSAMAGPEYREADREIAAPIEAVWAKLADLQTWSAFTPGLRRIVGNGADWPRPVRFEVRSHGFEIHYWVRVEMQRERGTLRIELDPDTENDVDAMSTLWQLTPTDEGRATRVQLASHFRSGMPVPGFIENAVLQSSIEATLDGLAALVAEPTP